MFLGRPTNWVTDKDITNRTTKHTNKRTKAKEPEGIRGKKDRHKTGNTQETDKHGNNTRRKERLYIKKKIKTSQKFKNPL